MPFPQEHTPLCFSDLPREISCKLVEFISPHDVFILLVSKKQLNCTTKRWIGLCEQIPSYCNHWSEAWEQRRHNIIISSNTVYTIQVLNTIINQDELARFTDLALTSSSQAPQRYQVSFWWACTLENLQKQNCEACRVTAASADIAGCQLATADAQVDPAYL